MNQLEKLTYIVPWCLEVRLEPREFIAQSSPLKSIFLMETSEGAARNAIIDIEDLGYENL